MNKELLSTELAAITREIDQMEEDIKELTEVRDKAIERKNAEISQYKIALETKKEVADLIRKGIENGNGDIPKRIFIEDDLPMLKKNVGI